MRCVVIHDPGPSGALKIMRRDRPQLFECGVRVAVSAVGINRADLLQRLGLYPAPAGVSQEIPGLEFSGTITETGPRSSRFLVGDRVMGLVAGGAYAEEVVLHERETMKVPTTLEPTAAAAVPEAFITAYDALSQLQVRPGQRVLVHAVGSGVGTAAVQLIKWMGATSVGTSRTPDKLSKAVELGLDEPVHVSDPSDFRGQFEPVHAVLDLVGGTYFSETMKSLRRRGKWIVVGLTAGAKAEISLAQLLNRRIQIAGTQLRHRPPEERMALARDFENHVVPVLGTFLRPVVDRVLSMNDMSLGHRLLMENRNFGKVILCW